MINTSELRSEERVQQGMTRKEMSEANRIVENNTLPASDDYERLLLASVIQYPELHLKRCAVKKEYFYNPVMGKIFGKICEMYKAGIGINVTTVLHEIKNEDAEIILYGLQDADTTKCDIRFKTYENGIIDAWKRRQTIQNLLEVVERTYKSNDLSAIQNGINTISDVLKIGNGNQWTPESTVPDWILNEPEPFKFVIPGLLASGVVGFIYGSGGTYKSLAALWLILQRATMKIDASQKWFDKFEPTFGKSIFFSAEDVQLDLHHRVFNIVSAMKDNRPDVPEQAFIDAIFENCRILPREKWIEDGEPFIIDENGPTNKVNRVIDLINSFGADLAILETRSRIANIDGNDNSAGARLLAVLERIRDETGATILVIDHSSKVTRGAKTDLQGQNSLIGAGVKLDNGRFGLLVEAQKRNNGSDILKITNSKGFRCKRADSFKVEVDYPKFSLVEDEDLKPDIFDRVIDFIKQNEGITVSKIRKGVTGGNEAINQALRDGKTEGLLEVMEKGGYKYVG